jgi:hypothetical protein
MFPALSGKLCPFCKVHRSLPMNLHREDCTWRLAWELIDSDEPNKEGDLQAFVASEPTNVMLRAQ